MRTFDAGIGSLYEAEGIGGIRLLILVSLPTMLAVAKTNAYAGPSPPT